MAGKPGDEVKMHIKDLPFKPGQEIVLSIKAVDGAGNIGNPFSQNIQVAFNQLPIHIKEPDISPFPPNSDLLKCGSLEISVLDLLDKVNPQTGRIIPEQKEGYKGGNHIFSAQNKLIRLHGSRNEHVAFQINFKGKSRETFVNYKFKNNSKLRVKLYEFGYVKTGSNNSKVEINVLPDPLLPFNGSFSIPSTAGKVRIENQLNHSIVLEAYIPHNEPPGKKTGTVSIQNGDRVLELDVELTVWDFTLPDKLSFVPEMNVYSKVSPYRGYEYYRLAHEHRTCLNRLPYAWSGKPDFSPEWNGSRFNWAEWDKRIGPLLDGSAFNDMPRRGEPVDMMYLPFSENWPVNIFKHYTPSYWADEAFTPEYESMLKKSFRLFAKHCNEKKWYDTIFQFYLNNKIYYRSKYHKSSAPWLFDEPMNTQDFWALRWYGLLWRSAVDQVEGDAKNVVQGRYLLQRV